MKNCIKAGVITGIVLFFYGYISWMFIPWHEMTLHHFKSDVAVSQIIQANAPESGIYIVPSMNASSEVKQEKVPMMFAAINLAGMPSTMTLQMIIGLLTNIIGATLVACLLKQTKLSYVGKVIFVIGFAIAASVISITPNWNWFGFDTVYSLVMFADSMIEWLIAGLILAWMV